MNINPDAPGASTLDAQPVPLEQPTPDLLKRYATLLADPVVADALLCETRPMTEALIRAYEERQKIRDLCMRLARKE